MDGLILPTLRTEKSISRQIRDAVFDMISRNGMNAGDRLPSEAELCAAFKVSRPSLREGLGLLEQEGLIRTQHGRGRFVSAAASLKVARPITTYESISVMLRELGYEARTRVLSVREALAGSQPEAQEALGCPASTPLVVIERVREDGDEALVYSVETVPSRFLPDHPRPGLFEGSLNDVLALSRNRPMMSRATISATVLPEAASHALGRPPKEPWLLITETCFTEGGDTVVHARDFHRGDVFAFNFSRR